MKIIEIDLLPPEDIPESPYSLRNIAILVISFMIAVWLIFLALRMSSLKNEYAQREAELTQKLTAYKIQKEKIDRLQKRKAELEKRYELITDVLGQRITWHDKLIAMHRQMPENVWLSQVLLEIQEAEKSQTEIQTKTSTPQVIKENVQLLMLFNISGYAIELPRVGELIANLDNSPSFEKTSFKKIDKTEINARSIISFNLTTQVSGLQSKLLSETSK
jgi:Tfp pilus assembly protein PilN